MTRRCLAGTKQHGGRSSDPARASGQDQMEQWIEKLRQCGPPIGGGGASKNPSQQGWMLMEGRWWWKRCWVQLHAETLVHYDPDSTWPKGTFKLSHYFVYFPPPAERSREFEIALLPRPPVSRSVEEAELRPTTAHYFCAESEKDYEDWRRKLRENGDEIEAAGGEVQYRKWRTNPTAKDGGGQPVQVPSQRRRRPDRDRDGDAPTRAGVAEPPDGQHGLQDFDILNMLGEGAFGKVLLVRHRTEKKQYAMKVMLKEAVAKANNEEQVTFDSLMHLESF